MAQDTTSTQTPAPVGPPTAFAVQGTPVAGTVRPDPEKAEFMRRHNALREFNDPANILANRIADSDLVFVDDNVANRRYVTKRTDSKQSPFGSPSISLQIKSFPAELGGVLFVREDGSSFSIPAGVRTLAEVVDPDTGKNVLGGVDPERQKARLEAAGIPDAKVKEDGSIEFADEPEEKAAKE